MVAVVIASCGSPTAPTSGATDLRGSYTASPFPWHRSEVTTYAQPPGNSAQTDCRGTLDVTSQDGTTFSGRYSIDCLRSNVYTGTVVDGRIGPSTQLSFRIVAETGGDPAVPPAWSGVNCHETDPERYEGTVNGSSLNVSRTVVMDCPQGRVLLTSSFNGIRQ